MSDRLLPQTVEHLHAYDVYATLQTEGAHQYVPVDPPEYIAATCGNPPAYTLFLQVLLLDGRRVVEDNRCEILTPGGKEVAYGASPNSPTLP